MPRVFGVLLILSTFLVFDIVCGFYCCNDDFAYIRELDPMKPRCYRPMNDWKSNYFQSRMSCESIGARLATIHSSDQNNFVLRLAKELIWSAGKEPNYVWMGLVKDEKAPVTPADPTGNWFWSHDKSKPVYTNWLKGFPGNWEGHTCAIMYVKPGRFGTVGGEWRDANCEELQAPYVCEHDVHICG